MGSGTPSKKIMGSYMGTNGPQAKGVTDFYMVDLMV